MCVFVSVKSTADLSNLSLAWVSDQSTVCFNVSVYVYVFACAVRESVCVYSVGVYASVCVNSTCRSYQITLHPSRHG